MADNNVSGSRRKRATSTGSKSFRNIRLDALKLKNTRVVVRSASKVILGRVSAVLTAPAYRSIRFTFLPKSRKAMQGVESLEFELSKVDAWALAEWMTDQATARSPERVKK